jgi:hypothetical protein
MNKLNLSLHDYLLMDNDDDDILTEKKPTDWLAIIINILIFICAFTTIYN